ncbi:MAG: DUF4115 domain-containing protein [Proteobacteria bacterium]|nr:DUF4115 domain-containing protein [Pseudomonadota bacterium]MDE3208923.1 DUF4115 domain-containing protein [Pseudomonadota bacterium]
MTEEIEQDSVSVGYRLRIERERQALSRDEVAAKLHLSVSQVEAIEEDDYSGLPALTFVRGFVRNYAKLLHLDSENLLALMPQSPWTQQGRISVPGERIFFRDNTPFPSTRRRNWHERILQLLLLIAFVVVFILIFFHSEVVKLLTQGAHPVPLGEKKIKVVRPVMSQVEKTPVTVHPSKLTGVASGSRSIMQGGMATTASSAASPVKSIVSPLSSGSKSNQDNQLSSSNVVNQEMGAGPIKLIFNNASWVQVTDSTGKSLVSGLNPPHTQLVVQGVPPYHVVIGNAPGVELVYNGKPVDLGPYTHSKTARLNLE